VTTDFDAPPAARGERLALLLDEPDDGRPDNAQTGNTDFQRGNHESSNRRPA